MFIVTSHCVRAFIPHYLSPADEYNGTPHLFQRPYFRMIASGPFWTSIFFLLSGYVCAIKPLRLANAGQADEARRVIASSGFRRVFRIGLPATLGTMFAWALAQMGAFETVGPIDFWADWLPHTTPHQVRGFYGGLRALVMQCVYPINLDPKEGADSSLIHGQQQKIGMKEINGH
jgi:peptidoglycan/LPS O-acetylase OafA/YrhL